MNTSKNRTKSATNGVEKRFDQLAEYAHKSPERWSYFPLYGFMTMAISIMTHLVIGGKAALGMGIVGVITGYIGIILTIMSFQGRSRLSKVAMILVIPLLIAVIVLLYR